MVVNTPAFENTPAFTNTPAFANTKGGCVCKHRTQRTRVRPLANTSVREHAFANTEHKTQRTQRSQAAKGCRLQAAGSWLLAGWLAGWLLAAGCWLLAAGCRLQAADCPARGRREPSERAARARRMPGESPPCCLLLPAAAGCCLLLGSSGVAITWRAARPVSARPQAPTALY
jgi:hypothetical protein